MTRAAAVLLTFVLLACAAPGKKQDVGRLVKRGKWLTARETIDERLAADPNDTALMMSRAEIDAEMRQKAEGLDYRPQLYLYGRVYLEYFERKRYRKALELMQALQNFALDNEELIFFMDKAQSRLEEDDARTAQKISAKLRQAESLANEKRYGQALSLVKGTLALNPKEPQALRLRGKLQVAIDAKPAINKVVAVQVEEVVAPDRDWIEAQEIEAMMAKLRGDDEKAAQIAREIAKQDPHNANAQQILRRTGQAR